MRKRSENLLYGHTVVQAANDRPVTPDPTPATDRFIPEKVRKAREAEGGESTCGSPKT